MQQIRDVDNEIISRLTLRDVYQLNNTNTYFRQLCRNEINQAKNYANRVLTILKKRENLILQFNDYQKLKPIVEIFKYLGLKVKDVKNFKTYFLDISQYAGGIGIWFNNYKGQLINMLTNNINEQQFFQIVTHLYYDHLLLII